LHGGGHARMIPPMRRDGKPQAIACRAGRGHDVATLNLRAVTHRASVPNV
jgi:hypothetical protein